MGPVEVLVLAFPGSTFNGKVAPALAELVKSGTIRIIDLLFVSKNDNGDVVSVEVEELSDDDKAALDDVDGETGWLLGQEDIDEAAAQIEPGSSALLLAWENVWAAKFAEAVRASGGEVKLNIRIPGALVEEALAHEGE